ncbi:MAG TPA: hypothetical protein VGL48_09570 [Acidimicrobiales bacterium]
MDRLVLAAQSISRIREPRVSGESGRRRFDSDHDINRIAVVGPPRLDDQGVGEALVTSAAEQAHDDSTGPR